MIHAYKSNGYNIIIDVNSGCVHSVDEVAYDVIKNYSNMPQDKLESYILTTHSGKITKEEFSELCEDIEQLKKEGKLFSEDPFRDHAFDFKKRQSVIKAMCLHVAHDCNLACKYCFAGDGEYCSKGLMSFEVGKAAFDYLIAHSGTRKNLEVDFFGGEPTLNFEVVKQLVEYGRSIEKQHNKNFRFTFTTNGVKVTDEIMDFCDKEMSNVVMSLDGRREVNDRMRVNKNGDGCYDKIVPIFQEWAQRRNQQNYYIRGTYTKFNTDFASDIIHMADLGFKEISIEPVVASPNEPYALSYDDLATLKEQYDILAKEMIRREKKGEGFNFYHYMIDLEGGPCIVKRISGCGVGTEYMAVTPDGDIYPCHQFVGDEKFRMGNVFTGIENADICDEFKFCNVYAHEECKDCFARLYCSGGCAANAYHSTGSIRGVYELGCELHKKRIEAAIMMKVALSEEE